MPNNNNNDKRQNVWKKDNAYANNDHIWKNNNAYANNEHIWKKNDAYEKDQNYKEPFCHFWFNLKLTMQNIFSTDSGLQEEKRVFATDTDPLFLSYIAKLSGKAMVNLFIMPIMMIILMILIVYSNTTVTTLLVICEGAIFAYILFCPGWQIYSSYEYSISKTGRDFYEMIAGYYKYYVGLVVFGSLVGVIILVLLVGYGFPFDSINNLLGNLLDNLPNINTAYDILKFKKPDMNQLIKSLWIVEVSTFGYLLLYFLSMYLIKQNAKDQFELNKLHNVDLRKDTHIGQLSKFLDEH